jgi:hypothetical protein
VKPATLILGILAAFGATTVVNANSTDHLGKVTAGNSYEFAFASTKPPTSFTDYVVFDLKTSLDISETILAAGVSGLTVELQEKISGTWTDESLATTPTSYNFGDLSSGKWRLDITGDTIGPSGSSSLLIGNLNVAAVPEPASLAMILAGMGLLGVYQWRRRQRSGASVASGGVA